MLEKKSINPTFRFQLFLNSWQLQEHTQDLCFDFSMFQIKVASPKREPRWSPFIWKIIENLHPATSERRRAHQLFPSTKHPPKVAMLKSSYSLCWWHFSSTQILWGWNISLWENRDFFPPPFSSRLQLPQPKIIAQGTQQRLGPGKICKICIQKLTDRLRSPKNKLWELQTIATHVAVSWNGINSFVRKPSLSRLRVRVLVSRWGEQGEFSWAWWKYFTKKSGKVCSLVGKDLRRTV